MGVPESSTAGVLGAGAVAGGGAEGADDAVLAGAPVVTLIALLYLSGAPLNFATTRYRTVAPLGATTSV
jgi:hypothetical protein